MEKSNGAGDADGRVRDCVLESSQEDLTNRDEEWNLGTPEGMYPGQWEQPVERHSGGLGWEGQMAEPQQGLTREGGDGRGELTECQGTKDSLKGLQLAQRVMGE